MSSDLSHNEQSMEIPISVLQHVYITVNKINAV